MKVICCNSGVKCEHNIYEREFEVEDFDMGKCPECGSSKISPAWTKEYRLPGEEALLKERIGLHESLKGIEEKERLLKKCGEEDGKEQ